VIVYRGSFSSLWVTLQSNEQLGILDTDYLEDWAGNDGQVTVHHVEGATDYPVLMVEQPAQTPGTANDVFRGQIDLDAVPDGNYEIRGRCRDIVGNYTILNSVQSPVGGEQVIAMGFEIKAGAGLNYPMPASAVLVRGVYVVQLAARPEYQ
jgi:hypothetical protein